MALTPIDFPDDPYTGESFTAGNGVTYTWYNNRWNGKVNDVILTVPPEDIELNMLQDVCDDVPADGDVLTWDGTEWCGKEGPADGVSPVVTVGATNTLPAGSPANVTQAPTADGTELTFSIPQGEKGEPGTGITFKGTIDEAGPPSFDGTADGDMWVDVNDNAWIWEGAWVDAGSFTGPPGAPGTQVSVGSTTTVEPGQPAAVTETVDGTNLQLNFFIPKGEKGDAGSINNMPDGVVAETGHYESGDVVDGIKFGRGGGSDRTYEVDFAIRTAVTFNGSVDFDSRGTVTGLKLETADNVTITNPQVGDVLKHAGNGEWVNSSVEGGSSSDVDLSDYTKRNIDEIITGNWKFEERTQMSGIKVLGYTNDAGVTESFIHFYEAKDWSPGEVADVVLRLDEIDYADGSSIKMLDLEGGGLQIISRQNAAESKRGGLNLLPTGIDIWRDGDDPNRTAHIDFKTSNTDTDSADSWDVRLGLDSVTYGAGDTYDVLKAQGGGLQIINAPEAPANRRGEINILPTGIDIIRPADQNFNPHIDFKDSTGLSGWEARIESSVNADNFIIKTKQRMLLQDSTGAYYLNTLAGGGGSGGGVMPGAGYGLQYSGNTLNVNTSEIATKDDLMTEERVRQIAFDVMDDYQEL